MYDVVVKRCLGLGLGKYEVVIPLTYFNQIYSVSMYAPTFKDAYHDAKDHISKQPYLKDAKFYYLDQDAQRSKYDLWDDGIVMMLILLLSE
jgi:hypothetical protein